MDAERIPLDVPVDHDAAAAIAHVPLRREILIPGAVVFWSRSVVAEPQIAVNLWHQRAVQFGGRSTCFRLRENVCGIAPSHHFLQYLYGDAEMCSPQGQSRSWEPAKRWARQKGVPSPRRTDHGEVSPVVVNYRISGLSDTLV